MVSASPQPPAQVVGDCWDDDTVASPMYFPFLMRLLFGLALVDGFKGCGPSNTKAMKDFNNDFNNNYDIGSNFDLSVRKNKQSIVGEED